MKHTINSRKEIFSGRAFKIQELNVSLPDGRKRNYELVFHRDSATIIPVDENGDIWLVEQFRMGSNKKLIELPAGVIDNNETPAECAAREIREEIGMAAGKLTPLGAVYLAPGYSSELNHIFLAEELNKDPLQQDEDEFLSVIRYSKEELSIFITKGGLQDSKSLAALYIYDQIAHNT
ncbi:MAG: NUDIX hydrolase [Anaerolineaceae bacterium]|nr:NUDIX hydrolase [Anaerolineaceae bacterium]